MKTNLKKQNELKIGIWCWVSMIPVILLYVMFQGYPIITSIFHSTLDWSGMTSSAVFIGLDNFKQLFQDKYFLDAVLNGFKYMLLCVPIQLAASLALAYIFSSVTKKGATVFWTIFFLSVITTASTAGIIMMFIFGGTGPINQFLELFGFKTANRLGNVKTILSVVMSVDVWKDVGTYMIYWLAALQSVSQDVYKVAMIDGVGKWQTFSKVVFPLTLPTGDVTAVLCVISSLKVFDLARTMANGGPLYAIDVVATFVYRTAYVNSFDMPRLGYASAAAMTFGIVVMGIGMIGDNVKSALASKRNA